MIVIIILAIVIVALLVVFLLRRHAHTTTSATGRIDIPVEFYFCTVDNQCNKNLTLSNALSMTSTFHFQKTGTNVMMSYEPMNPNSVIIDYNFYMSVRGANGGAVAIVPNDCRPAHDLYFTVPFILDDPAQEFSCVLRVMPSGEIVVHNEPSNVGNFPAPAGLFPVNVIFSLRSSAVSWSL